MTDEAARDKATPFERILAERLSRRTLIERGLAVGPLALSVSSLLGCATTSERPHVTARWPDFNPVAASTADAVVLPPGYHYDVVVRWGDGLDSSTPDLEAATLASGGLFEADAAKRQQRQFGQNCDAIHYFPFDERGDRGLLCVNNEYTLDELMFPGHPGLGSRKAEIGRYVSAHPEVVAFAQAAQGMTVVEVALERGHWRYVRDSRFNRRITAQTPIAIGGPARGDALMRTPDDPEGVRVLGTFANCAGGRTPWGTFLSAEENIQDYFGNFEALAARHDLDEGVLRGHDRWRMHGTHSLYAWETADPRFDLRRSPAEPFRFGWIVELDPMDPLAPPVKRTALGRFAHEAASPVIADDGRVAVYMGDDDRFEYIYKFVSNGRYDPRDPRRSRDLLDSGVLYVARFDANGTGEWLPLVHDERGPLNAANGFRNQAEVLIRTRAAATALGATPMDRPEDVEVHPVTGRVYIACTRNERRTSEPGRLTWAGRDVDTGPNAANPRGRNDYGHIIELREDGDDHTARGFSWEIFLLAGDPAGGSLITDLADVRTDSTYYAGYANAAELSPIGSPDNIGFDAAGNLWIVTDGPQPRGGNNGCWVCPTSGPDRGRLQQFMSGPVGAEICGCVFTPDSETLFLSVQHPGEGSSVLAPSSHWPDGPGHQPRSSVIAIRRDGGGPLAG